MNIFSFILCVIPACLLVLQANAAGAPEVTTANGIIRGQTVVGSNGKEVYVFYGIPYAKPPVGDLRFKRPVPYTDKWTTPLDATKRPNTCPQTIRVLFPDFNGEDALNPNTQISEDCLYLNVFVPKSQFQKSTNVYFWIYGGGFASGTSTLDIYSGTNLAAEKDVIVVTTQYRVSVIGLLYIGTDDAPGNQGLVDQQVALQWVNDNIKAFGGDPSEICLMGESAGSASVSHHLLAPGSQNLFKRAVMMSGVAIAAFAYTPPAQMLEQTNQIARDAGCLKNDSANTPAQIISCLRDLSMDEILNVGGGVRSPTLDNYFISEEPKKLLQKWETKRSEIMIGDVMNEGNSFLLEIYNKYFNHANPTSLPYDGYLSIMKQLFVAFPEIERNAIINFYTNWINKDDGYANQQKLGEAFGDAYFNCPDRDFADQWSARGLKVYSYFLTHRTESSLWGKWMGVRHTDDIVYFLGQPLGNDKYTKAEQDLSRKIIDLVANFAKTGVPSPNWKSYTREYPYYLDLNATVISDETSSGVLGPRAKACAFWNVYLPQLRKSLEELKQPVAPAKKCCCNKDKA